MTSYFRHRFSVEEGSREEFLAVEVLRDDGVIVYLNGEELLRDNMPDGSVSARTAAWTATRSTGSSAPQAELAQGTLHAHSAPPGRC